jgi:CHAT domain-containing protein
LVKSNTAETRNRLRGLLYELTQMEAQAGLDLPSMPPDDPSPAGRISRLLRPTETLFSFHLGELESYRWTLTRTGLVLHRLPPAKRIRDLVRTFREELAKGTTETTAVGEELHTLLFASAPVEARRKPNWLLALDQDLFELPFPALVLGRDRSGKPRFLIESHSVRTVPRAAMIGTRSPAAYGGSFVGLADPVYNRADPRWTAAPLERRFRRLPHWADKVLAGSRRAASPQLARLAGGRTEAERCARMWRADNRAAVILSGMEASSRRLEAALKGRPSVVHLATHFVKASEPIPQALLALSLNERGEPEFLGPTEVSRWNFPMGLVVLSGCSSGQAAALPGAGLMGMTRAWLAAGAQAVASSLWPTPDDSGEMFAAFYRHLRRLSARPRPGIEAEALRLAQLEMLRSGTWRAGPRYWAAFSVVGKG